MIIMLKVTVKIDGMMCGMCEAHICDALRNAFPGAKKVKASRKRSEASFVTDVPVNEESIKRVISNTGYTPVSISVQQN